MTRPALRSGLLSLALFVALSAFGQNVPPPSQTDARKGAQNLINIHSSWGPKASTPNMSLAIKETSRSGQIIKFGLFADGLPKDKTYSVVSWPITVDTFGVIMSGVTFNSAGVAICAGLPNTCVGKKPNDPIDFLTQPIPGEPLRLGVVSDDRSIKLFAKTVPLPIKSEDRGCTLEAVLLTPDAAVLWIEGSGFAPGSELALEGNSEGERQSKTDKADSDGHYISSALPQRQGLARGTIEIALRSTKCSPSVNVSWGPRN